METICVSIAEIAVAKEPSKIETQSLGSCIGIALYDPIAKIGGLAHVMLPDSKKVQIGDKPGKYADTAVRQMIDKMIEMGAQRERIGAKIAGGSYMFFGETTKVNEFMNIGSRNIQSVKGVLEELKIPLVASDCGGNYGRTVELDISTGKLKIKSAMRETKEI